MRNALPRVAVLVLILTGTSCSDPKAAKFDGKNNDKVLSQAVTSDKLTNEEKDLLREYVGAIATSKAAAAMLGAMGADAKSIPSTVSLDGKTVGQVIEEMRGLKAKEQQEKAESERIAREKKAAVDAYIANLELKVGEVSPPRDSLMGTSGWVKLSLKNGGDKTLRRVTVTAYLLDASGKRIREESCLVVFASSLGLHSSGPLKPNYVANDDCRIKDPPTEWANKVEAAVTEIEFEG